LVVVLLSAALLSGIGAPHVDVRAAVPPPTLRALDPPVCRPGDSPYTALQGQVPVGDRVTGRAARHYWCNLEHLGDYVEPGRVDVAHGVPGAWATLDTYEHCAYYGDAAAGVLGPSPQSAPPGGTVVLDVSNPRHPVQTAYLTAAAMQAPWEVLRVNARRGLLVAGRNMSRAFAVYDVKTDCRHPRLLFDGELQRGLGHEGYFAPDGRTFYLTDGGTPHLTAIDLTNPNRPRELGYWDFPEGFGFHGGSTSIDGSTGYQCEYTNPGSVRVLDLSGVQRRTRLSRPRTLARIPLPNNMWCQATYSVTYNGRPYLIQYGERSQVRCPKTAEQPQEGGDSSFDYPRIIDMSRPARPRIVGNLAIEVDMPENCPLVAGDVSPRSIGFASVAGGGGALFGYDVHHCTPDRLVNPRVLACGQFLAGLMVYDIRNPARPKELAYFNMGTVSPADPTVDDAISRPVIRANAGLVYWTTEWGGFHTGRFTAGPLLGGAECGAPQDYLFEQYNPGATCPRNRA
jgi:hypothetical protein